LRQAYDYWQDQPGNYPFKRLGNSQPPKVAAGFNYQERRIALSRASQANLRNMTVKSEPASDLLSGVRKATGSSNAVLHGTTFEGNCVGRKTYINQRPQQVPN
jgi:hypothetical protein